MLRIAAGIFLVALIVRISVGTVQRLFGEVRVTLAGRQPLGYGSPVVALVAGAALAAVLVVPLTLPYFVNREVLGDRSRDEIRYYSAEPRDYLVAHERNALYGPLTAHRGKPERQLLQGILLPVLAVVGMWPPLSVARIAYVFALLFAFEASLGFNGYVFDWLYSYVVAYKGLRVPSRFAILVGLSLAVLAGFGVARLRAMVPRRWSPFVAAGLALIVLFEYRSIIKLEMVWTDPPPVYERFIGQPQSVLIEFPVFIPGGVHETKYMYFSTFHWQTLVNGYSGFGPPSYYRTLEAIRNFPDDSSLTYLQRLGVDYAIVHGAFYDPAVYADLVSRLDERTDVLLVESYRWMKAESRLYRISQRPSGS